MSKHHHHGHKHHDHKKTEDKAEHKADKGKSSSTAPILGDVSKPENSKTDEDKSKPESATASTPVSEISPEPVAEDKKDLSAEFDAPSDSKEPSDSKDLSDSIGSDAPAAATAPDKDPANDPEQASTDSKEAPELFVSESEKVQDANSNTETGKVLNPGTTDAAIEIVQHATPAADASISAQKRDEAIANGETPEYHPEADAMNPGPKVEEIADSSSGNSITGATAPVPFHPWDDAKEKTDGAKDELVENLSDAAKPATADGQADEPVPSTDATTAEQANGSTPGTDDLENASGLSATDETAPAEELQ